VCVVVIIVVIVVIIIVVVQVLGKGAQTEIAGMRSAPRKQKRKKIISLLFLSEERDQKKERRSLYKYFKIIRLAIKTPKLFFFTC